MSNPFYVGGPVPPSYFIEQSNEVKTAFDQIDKRAHLALYGSSGFGKSSLLRYIASSEAWGKFNDCFQSAYIVLINCGEIQPFTPSSFWSEVIQLLKEEVSDPELVSLLDNIINDKIVSKNHIKSLLRLIGRRRRFLLLLIDEYDNALRENSSYSQAEMLAFVSEFRSVAIDRSVGEYLSTIVTSYRRLSDLGPSLKPGSSPWYNHYLFRRLKPLKKELVNELLSVSIQPKIRRGIVRAIGGNIALLQNAGYLIYEAIQDGKNINLDDFIFSQFLDATKQYFKNDWEASSEEEKSLLILISLYRLEGRINNKQYSLKGIDLIFSQYQRELKILEERGLVIPSRQEDEVFYKFSSSIMQWWVVQEIYFLDRPEIQQVDHHAREKVWLRLLSRSQAEQISKNISYIWNNEKVQDIAKKLIISELSDLSELLDT